MKNTFKTKYIGITKKGTECSNDFNRGEEAMATMLIGPREQSETILHPE
jgi:hypothetical protein